HCDSIAFSPVGSVQKFTILRYVNVGAALFAREIIWMVVDSLYARKGSVGITVHGYHSRKFLNQVGKWQRGMKNKMPWAAARVSIYKRSFSGQQGLFLLGIVLVD